MGFFGVIALFSLIIFSVVLFFPVHHADAKEYALNEGDELEGCESIGGHWSEKNLLCYVSDLIIHENDSLTIDIEYMVLFTGTLENNGKIIQKNPDGGVMFGGVFNNNKEALFEGHGIISNDVIVPNHPDYRVELGMINNHGMVENFGGFTVGGKYHRVNSTTPDDFVVLENHGTFTNHAFLGFNPGTTVNNHGTFVNNEYLSFSTLNVKEGSRFTNEKSGLLSVGNALTNNGVITNHGTFEDRFCSGIVKDSGTIIGNQLVGEGCSGTKTGNDVTQDVEFNDAKGGGCLIATAAYGSELAPQVQFLREVRYNTVLSTESGTSFMAEFNRLYYSFSPAIADMQRENPMFQEAVKVLITPMISTLYVMTLAENGSETDVLALGLYVIALNLAIYVGTPATIAVIAINKHQKS